MSKNVGPWLAFGSAFFAHWQWLLLFLLNTPVVRWWFRWVMCIDMAVDVWLPPSTQIVAIGPSYYTVRLTDGLRSSFRTHPKYAKRIYWAFRWVWEAAHAFDSVFADRWAPRLSFGFSTLEKFPDPDPETTTVDGKVLRGSVDETWATIIAGAGTAANDSSATFEEYTRTIATTTANQFSFLWRGIALFDTSAIPDTDDVTAAVLSVRGDAKADGLVAAPDIDVYTSTPASNTALVAADYSQVGSVSQTGSPITFANWSTTGYNDFTFNATGRGNISKTGVSKFGTRNTNYDVAATAPPWLSGAGFYLTGRKADNAGTAEDPKLVVTYSAAATLGGPLVGGRLADSRLLVGGRLAR